MKQSELSGKRNTPGETDSQTVRTQSDSHCISQNTTDTRYENSTEYLRALLAHSTLTGWTMT